MDGVLVMILSSSARVRKEGDGEMWAFIFLDSRAGARVGCAFRANERMGPEN